MQSNKDVDIIKLAMSDKTCRDFIALILKDLKKGCSGNDQQGINRANALTTYALSLESTIKRSAQDDYFNMKIEEIQNERSRTD
ncbi:hypothetical protein [Bathymodiolus japonicus methanotrophic gill symbiont]|uniref:hypothetical protein n=1 Tax=Bathymodiolus japonicus methanotrophic gill symbiont TaxID=113269 RepID=UPI001C8D0ABD|nr:hypothetical protein [Bathymodiolus japonicus methanotrophic gill symbiont]